MRPLWAACTAGHQWTTHGKTSNSKQELLTLGLRVGREHDKRFRGCHATHLVIGTWRASVLRVVNEIETTGEVRDGTGVAVFGRADTTTEARELAGQDVFSTEARTLPVQAGVGDCERADLRPADVPLPSIDAGVTTDLRDDSAD